MLRPSLLPFCVSLFITYAIHYSTPLKILMLDVPSPVIVGESVELTCSYDLESDKLYSFKFYKNDFEFYRYVPKDWPPAQFLPMNGIRVDLTRSNKRSVYLKHVDLHSEGIYRCEVSAEAPSFNTAEMEKEMKVYALPTEGPRIFGSRPSSKVGEVVSVNCTSTKSKPPAVLEWFINDNSIDSSSSLGVSSSGGYEVSTSSQQDKDGLEVTSLALKFVISEKHFNHGIMRLKCAASIGRMYTMRSEILVVSGDDDAEDNGYRKLKTIENLSQVRSSGLSRHKMASPSFVLLSVVSLLAIIVVSSSSLLPPRHSSHKSILNAEYRLERYTT